MTKENEELIALARRQFRDEPLCEALGVAPDSVMDVHRRLADALEELDWRMGGLEK